MFLEKLISTGIIFGIVSMLGWGVGDFTVALATRKIGNIRSYFFSYLIGLIILLTFVFLAQIPFTITPKAILLSLIASLFHFVAAFSFYQGLKIGKVSLVSPIASSYAFILVLASVVIFGEKLSMLQAVSITGIILGNIFVSGNIKELLFQLKLKKSDPGIPYAFFTMLFWGIGFLFLNKAVYEIGPLFPTIILYISGLLFLLPYILVRRFSLGFSFKKSTVIYLFINGGGSALAYIFYSIGVEKYLTAIIAPITASFPLVTVFLALFLLKEKISFSQLLGIFLVIGGVVILSI